MEWGNLFKSLSFAPQQSVKSYGEDGDGSGLHTAVSVRVPGISPTGSTKVLSPMALETACTANFSP